MCKWGTYMLNVSKLDETMKKIVSKNAGLEQRRAFIGIVKALILEGKTYSEIQLLLSDYFNPKRINVDLARAPMYTHRVRIRD